MFMWPPGCDWLLGGGRIPNTSLSSQWCHLMNAVSVALCWTISSGFSGRLITKRECWHLSSVEVPLYIVIINNYVPQMISSEQLIQRFKSFAYFEIQAMLRRNCWPVSWCAWIFCIGWYDSCEPHHVCWGSDPVKHLGLNLWCTLSVPLGSLQ